MPGCAGLPPTIDIATANIRYEFNLRDIAFLPQNRKGQIPYLNRVLRPNIIKLREFAGLERALVANTIARGTPFSHETMTKIKHYRSIVEQSLSQILLLKGQPSTSKEMEQAIMDFEQEFTESFQELREKVFVASQTQEDAIKAASIQIIEKKATLKNYLAGISNHLLNVSHHSSVIGLGKALLENDNTFLPEWLQAVETLFKHFSQLHRKHYKVRFLDNSGQERVRLDSDDNFIKVVRGKELQNKSHRYYFQNSQNLLPREIYLSPLDLNIEHGQIEVPFRPTFRL